jgi:hypothetical protein
MIIKICSIINFNKGQNWKYFQINFLINFIILSHCYSLHCKTKIFRFKVFPFITSLINIIIDFKQLIDNLLYLRFFNLINFEFFQVKIIVVKVD